MVVSRMQQLSGWLPLVAPLLFVPAVRQATQSVLESAAGGFGSTFTIENNSTLPLNFLSITLPVRDVAETNNNIHPHQSFMMQAVGQQEIHIVVFDGHSYFRDDHGLWTLVKDGLQLAVNSASGVPGWLGRAAYDKVASTLAWTAERPWLASLATSSAEMGVSLLSAIFSQPLGDDSADKITKRWIELMATASGTSLGLNSQSWGGSGPTGGSVRLPQESEKLYYRFRDVVTEATVRLHVQAAFPEVNLMERAVLKKPAIDLYFKAMESDFKTSKMAKTTANRKFSVVGGFMSPTEVVDAHGKTWLELDFLPLSLAEVEAEYGCRHVTKLGHWGQRRETCEKECKQRVVLFKDEETLEAERSCLVSCLQAFQEPLQIEGELVRIVKELRKLKGTMVEIQAGDEETQALLVHASREAGLPMKSFEARMQALGDKGIALEVDEESFSLKLRLEAAKQTVWLPAEMVIAPSTDQPLLSQEERLQISELQGFGECYSRKVSLTSLFNMVFADKGTVRPECLANDEETRFAQQNDRLATVCKADEHCGSVLVEDEKAHWKCVA